MANRKQPSSTPHPIIQQIQTNSDRLFQAFDQFGSQVDLSQKAPSLLRQAIQILQLTSKNFNSLLLSYQNLVKASFSQNSTQTFQDFKQTLAAWVVSNNLQSLKLQKVQQLFLQQLQKSLKQYRTLQRQLKDPDQQASIQQLLQLLQNKRNEVIQAIRPKNVNFSFRKEVTKQQEKGVEQIFKFYSKQHVMPGKAPTFDHLGSVVGVVQSGIFIFFCKSFGIVSDKPLHNKRTLTKAQALDIFKRCATLRKELNFQGFKLALDEVAKLYFNQQYDQIAHISTRNIGLDEKRVMLFEMMKCGEPRALTAQLKPIGGNFSSNVQRAPRIGKDDKSRGYKLRISEQTKEQLSNYRKEKEEKLKQEREIKEKQTQSKVTIAKKRLKEKRENEELKKRKDVIRIQDLDKISYQDLGENENLEDLIM